MDAFVGAFFGVDQSTVTNEFARVVTLFCGIGT